MDTHGVVGEMRTTVTHCLLCMVAEDYLHQPHRLVSQYHTAERTKMELLPTSNNQLTEWEFELLARSGSELFIKLLTQRVRVTDRDTKSGVDFMTNVQEYLDINVKKQFHYRKGYHSGTVYFECPIELENFQRVLNASL